MARVPDFKRITVEDFPQEDQALVKKLAFPINSHIEQVRSALSKNLDFENLAQEIKTISFTTNENGAPLNTVTFKSNMANRVQGIQVVRTVITSNNTTFADQLPVISWSQAVDIVTIIHIGGLLPETQYELTLLTL